MRRFMCFVVFFLCFTSICYADKVYLKDGRIFEGNIMEINSAYTVIMVEDFPHKFYKSEIDRMEDLDAPKPIDTSIVAGVSSEKIKLIMLLMDVNGTRRLMDQNISQIMTQAPTERKEEFKAVFNLEEIILSLVPIYDQHYSTEELRSLIQFYQSPLGKKVLEVTPEIMTETIKVSVQYFQNKLKVKN